MSSSSNWTDCDQGSVPSFESTGIAKNITVGLTPGNNASYNAMEYCCSPNAVHVYDNCTLWCQLPDSMVKNSSSSDSLANLLNQCFRNSGANYSQIRAIEVHEAGASLANGPNIGSVVLLTMFITWFLG